MTTNIERAAKIIRNWMPQSPDTWEEIAQAATQALADAGLLMPDDGERLPSWVYDHPDVCTNPHRMRGQPCVRGTRVPVDIIFNLMDGPDGATDEEITYFYPHVPADQITRLRTAREEYDNADPT